MKRLFDIIVSLIAFILLFPIMIFVWILVTVKLGSPAIFRQERPGLNGKIFVMFKFRSMTSEKDVDGKLLPDGIRLTKFGKILRALSLDELPELINVLKGDMSLVGPRPLLVEYLKLYSKDQMRRHEVRPGITGYAQINGRNAIDWEEKFKLDIWYVENHSFWLDIKILFKTVLKVFKRDGISQAGNATMQKFTGFGA